MIDTMADDVCPKCGSALGEITETSNGKKLRRCSAGVWDSRTKKTIGCDFVKWLPVEPQTLEEVCPKCGAPLLLVVTRFGKKMKKCSASGWDKVAKKATGCDYVEWINGTSKPLEETCPKCGAALVLYTTAAGKQMKKCSTSGWDRVAKKATGCDYIQWLKSSSSKLSPGEEFLPPFPEDA